MRFPQKKDPTRIYWIKLRANFFESETMRILHQMPNGLLLQLFWIRLLLLCIEKIQDLEKIGFLRKSQERPYDANSLAFTCGIPAPIVVEGLRIFTENDMVKILEDGSIIIPFIHELIGSEGSSAERMRKTRESAKNIRFSIQKVDDSSIGISTSNELSERPEVRKYQQLVLGVPKEELDI